MKRQETCPITCFAGEEMGRKSEGNLFFFKPDFLQFKFYTFSKYYLFKHMSFLTVKIF